MPPKKIAAVFTILLGFSFVISACRTPNTESQTPGRL